MTAPSPSPKRRWLRWLGIGMAALIGWSVYSSWALDRRLAQWNEARVNKNIGVLATSDPMLPGLPIPGTNSSLNIPFLERRAYSVLVGDAEGVAAALSLPECPVRLVIVTSSDISNSDRKRLRDHFGPDNVR